MDIRARLKTHIDYLFVSAPQTRAIIELKEELLSNAVERFTDLTLQGKETEEAYQIVISSIGNVEELVEAVETEKKLPGINQEQPKKSAMIKAISVGLYFLAGIVLFGGALAEDITGIEYMVMASLIGAACIAVIPTIMLIYNAYAYPEYKKTEETVVENFKEFNSENEKSKTIRESVKSVIWLITTAVFFLVSFVTGLWVFSWIILIIGGVVNGIVDIFFKLRGEK